MSLICPPECDRPRKLWAPEIERSLRAAGVSRLFHITDRANLASIQRHGGLLSWHTCEQRGIAIPRPGGTTLSRRLDYRRGLEGRVRLCFNRRPVFVDAWIYRQQIVDPANGRYTLTVEGKPVELKRVDDPDYLWRAEIRVTSSAVGIVIKAAG